MFVKVIILACLAICTVTAEPNLDQFQLAYGAHLLGGINPELYASAKALTPLQYASGFPLVYAAQMLAGPVHKTVKPSIVSAPLQYAATLPPLLLTPHWHTAAAAAGSAVAPSPSDHHQLLQQPPSITPLLQPTLKLSEVLPTPPKSWTPLWADPPPTSTLAEYRLQFPQAKQWRPPVTALQPLRTRKLHDKSPYNKLLRVIIRRRPWAKHVRKLGQIVTRIRWLEKYLTQRKRNL
ncbi:uncharacterized protein LOC129726012 isoform X2 [Wyeomyia smithii]|uniref:uncharacterized protein LOC129726012 isoform X2 n=1 Tax=Wyeomyia smithii TaxID=174621 RepID=UPI002467D637|nr:uncharacterized protein LOC129726012 isoform X2 [Wyeomyia smithii]